jgi:hypothetical protein
VVRAAGPKNLNWIYGRSSHIYAKSQAGACDFGFQSMISTQAWF